MIELADPVEDVVVVGGHPRSGTSLACQVAETAGVTFKKEMGKDAYNKAGYYEMKDAKELSSHLVKKGMNEENTERLNKITEKLREQEKPRGIKIVHILSIPYFQQVLKEPKFVFIYRDPREVKSSMFRRGFSEFPIPWAKNNNAVLSLLQDQEQSILISYEDIMKKKETVKQKFKELNLQIDFSPVKSGWRTQKSPRLGLSEKEEKVYKVLEEVKTKSSSNIKEK